MILLAKEVASIADFNELHLNLRMQVVRGTMSGSAAAQRLRDAVGLLQLRRDLLEHNQWGRSRKEEPWC